MKWYSVKEVLPPWGQKVIVKRCSSLGYETFLALASQGFKPDESTYWIWCAAPPAGINEIHQGDEWIPTPFYKHEEKLDPHVCPRNYALDQTQLGPQLESLSL
jgi:hypothetical protein